MALYLGIDFGTSGARAIAIDAMGQIRAETQYPFETTTANLTSTWRSALFSLLDGICSYLRGGDKLSRIAINGTSATVLLCDNTGTPVDAPILYNDDRSVTVMDKVRAIAPPHHPVLSATSSLAKLLWWMGKQRTQDTQYFLHQADWLAFLLHGKLGVSDYHNALKLGYDVGKLNYPAWFAEGLHRLCPGAVPQFPQVVTPGTPIAEVTPNIARRFGLSSNCLVCAGTTDSIAAFLASGATSPGEAVTSLGSTLVLKLLSRTRIDDARYGIYSHRLGNLWLTGGASNTGGAVLRQFFTNGELETLSRQIPETESPLDYYPLIQPGERFPINDPQLQPRLTPRSNNSVEFLHGLLESMSRIEALGYQRLQQLGASTLSQVYTAGGGAKNLAWTRMRQRHLEVSVSPSVHTEAAYGTALLGMAGIEGLSRSI